MPNRDRILEKNVEPDITVEYIFIERAEKQVKPINDDQGYLMGFINIFISGRFKNDNVLAFKTQILDITKKEQGPFKGHFQVGLSIVD